MGISPAELRKFVIFADEIDNPAALKRLKESFAWLASTEHGAEQLLKSAKQGNRIGVGKIVAERAEKLGRNLTFGEVRSAMPELQAEATARGYDRLWVRMGRLADEGEDFSFQYNPINHEMKLPVQAFENTTTTKIDDIVITPLDENLHKILGHDGAVIEDTLESVLSHELDHAGRSKALRVTQRRADGQVMNAFRSDLKEFEDSFGNEALHDSAKALIADDSTAAKNIVLTAADTAGTYLGEKLDGLTKAMYSDSEKHMGRMEASAIAAQNKVLEMQGKTAFRGTNYLDSSGYSGEKTIQEVQGVINKIVADSKVGLDEEIAAIHAHIKKMEAKGTPLTEEEVVELFRNPEPLLVKPEPSTSKPYTFSSPTITDIPQEQIPAAAHEEKTVAASGEKRWTDSFTPREKKDLAIAGGIVAGGFAADWASKMQRRKKASDSTPELP